MTEKRYYSVDYDEQYYIFDSNVIRKGRVEEEAEYSYDVFANSMSSTEIIDKLNELTNENEQLKSSNMEMEDYLGRLEEENKQLKKDRNEMFIRERDTENEWRELKEENEQLKQTIKGVYEILSIDVDVFSDKAIEHDINAYIELNELDNKDAYYIAKGTKKAIELLKRGL